MDDSGSPEALTQDGHTSLLAASIGGAGVRRKPIVEKRLPRSVVPVRYEINLIPDFVNASTTGSVLIQLKAHEATNEIIFNIKEIEISASAPLTVSPSKSLDKLISINSHGKYDLEKYKITLNEYLEKGQEYDLRIPTFYGKLNQHLQGFYLSNYQDAGGNRIAASTQFSPAEARRAFPCFDEPQFKAKFKLSLARPANMTTLSNMPLERTLPIAEKPGWYWDHYQQTPKLPTYLVAFVISDLYPSNSSEASIKIWSRSVHKPQTNYVATITPQLLHFYEDYFQIKYPLPKIDIVGIPEFGFNAMENSGLIMFAESSLFYDSDTSTVSDKKNTANVLAHELVHQWFGNLVTPKWWDDLWLKEGFSTYFAYLGVDRIEPNWKIQNEFQTDELYKAFEADALKASRPLYFDIKNSKQIWEAFDDISYAKGASLVRMINELLGQEVFKKGLIKFLQKFQGSNADHNDLLDVLTEEGKKAGVLKADQDLKDIMKTWIERPGYPVVTAVADRKSGTIHLSQKRFLLVNPHEESTTWKIPISLVTSQNPDNISDHVWLNEKQMTINKNVSDSWYLLNINQTGYFMVNYDEANWRLLIKNLLDLPSPTRAQLISDSMELARANLLDYDIPFRLIANMAIKDDMIMFVPHLTAFNKLKFLSDILMETPAFGLFEEYHKSIFKRTYELVGFEDSIDDYITRRIRSTVLEWSCRSPDSRCVHESRSRFRMWMARGQLVEPNLREIVYCTALREGAEIEWNFAYNHMVTTDSPTEKNILLDALGCTRLKWVLARYIGKLIEPNSSIRIQDADRVFESVAKNRFGTGIAFDFLRKNWNQLQEHYGDGFNILGRMIRVLAAHMNSEFQLEELIRFRNSIKTNTASLDLAFDSAIETVQANVDWMQKNYQRIEKWLNQQQNNFLYL